MILPATELANLSSPISLLPIDLGGEAGEKLEDWVRYLLRYHIYEPSDRRGWSFPDRLLACRCSPH